MTGAHERSMQTLGADLRACVLDQLEFGRGGQVDDVFGEAEAMLDALLALAKVCRTWTRDAQARLRRTLLITDGSNLASMIEAGVAASVEVVVNVAFDERSDAAFEMFCQLIAGASLREYVGYWPRAYVPDHDRRARACAGLCKVAHLHLDSSTAWLTVESAVVTLRMDHWWNGEATREWSNGAVWPSLRTLDLDARDFEVEDVEDALLSTILRAAERLHTLKLSGVTLAEVDHALTPSVPQTLQHFSFSLVIDTAPPPQSLQNRADALARSLACQIIRLCLSTCSPGLPGSPRARHARLELSTLAEAWLKVMPAPAVGRTVVLRPHRNLVTDESGLDDGAFRALVAGFEALGARCSLETGTCQPAPTQR